MGQRNSQAFRMFSISKLATCTSEAKKFFSSKSTEQFKRKVFSLGKLGFTMILFCCIVAVYAYHVTDASTRGYYFSKTMKKQKELLIQQELINSEVILLQRDLWNKAGNRSPNRETRRSDIITVNTNPKMLTKTDEGISN